MTVFRPPRTRVRRNNPRPLPPARPMEHDGSLDKWLGRLSHFSQFALFLFTVGTIYYTVIPLYQKAVLEEAIARKEIELTRATALLDKAYVRVRANLLNNFVFGAGAECTGLLIRVREPEEIRGKERSISDTVLGIDTAACLTRNLNRALPNSELRESDIALLKSAVLVLATELQAQQSLAIADYHAVKVLAKTNPGKLPVPSKGAYERELERVLAPLMANESPAQTRQREMDRAVQSEQNRIAREYAEAVRNRVHAFAKFKWSK